MQITKDQLRRIIREVSAGSNYTVGRPDSRGTDHLFPDDPEHSLNKRDELATQIRHASKDIFGTKDHYDLRGKSIEELEDILYDLANAPEQRYMDDESRHEIEDQLGRDQELSRAEMAPLRQGMNRRPGGSKSQRRMESKMKITKRQLRRIIKEELATLNRDIIEDEVMQVLSDEGGAAGEEPIADALEDLESDEISLPDEPIEDIIGAVPGVKRHKDGDYIDTTQLEVRDSFKALIEELVAEVSGQIVCPNCGHKNSAGVDKCAKCGHPRDKGSWKEV